CPIHPPFLLAMVNGVRRNTDALCTGEAEHPAFHSRAHQSLCTSGHPPSESTWCAYQNLCVCGPEPNPGKLGPSLGPPSDSQYPPDCIRLPSLRSASQQSPRCWHTSLNPIS
ncbi:mCG145261, isoform CRA_b, partial [Mus musculus]